MSQTDFTDAPAGDYLTFCMEAATGYLPTGACADASYDTLQRYFATALTDPFAESNATTLEGVTAICNAGCDSQLLTLAQRYIGAMPTTSGGGPEDNSWCSAVTGNNTAPLLGNSLPFLCTQNDSDSYCVVEVGKALYEANVLQQLMSVVEGGRPFNTGDVDSTELCRAMFETGCCAQTFIDVVTSMLLMTCHSDTAQQLQSLFQGCQPALKPGCQYNFMPFEMPNDCPEGGLVLPKVGTECPIPTGSCPVTQCEFLCAVVAADPPGDFSSPASGVSSSADADEALGDSSGDGGMPGAGALASRQLSLSVAGAAAPARAMAADGSTSPPRQRPPAQTTAWCAGCGKCCAFVSPDACVPSVGLAWQHSKRCHHAHDVCCQLVADRRHRGSVAVWLGPERHASGRDSRAADRPPGHVVKKLADWQHPCGLVRGSLVSAAPTVRLTSAPLHAGALL